MKEHLRSLKLNKHCNLKMQNAYNKYQVFEFVVLSEHKTRLEAYLEEQKLLNLCYGEINNLNINPKATAPPVKLGTENPSKNPEIIKKIIETKKRLGLFVMTSETKEKISRANKGREHSEEEKNRRNISITAVKQTDIYKHNHKTGCINAYKNKTEKARLNSAKLFKENNPSYKKQVCEVCNKEITGASAYKRFHGEKCKVKL